VIYPIYDGIFPATFLGNYFMAESLFNRRNLGPPILNQSLPFPPTCGRWLMRTKHQTFDEG
jgi:hypothetical protein